MPDNILKTRIRLSRKLSKETKEQLLLLLTNKTEIINIREQDYETAIRLIGVYYIIISLVEIDDRLVINLIRKSKFSIIIDKVCLFTITSIMIVAFNIVLLKEWLKTLRKK